jgi:putative PIN family toxin of toxin-antitoxin system
VRVVLDSSVLVAAALSPGGPSGLVLQAGLNGRLDVVTSRSLLDEAERAIRRVVGVDVAAAIALLRDVSDVVSPDAIPEVSRDRDDDKVVATAVAGAVEYLVTNDHDLLALNRKGLGFACIQPQRLLEIMGYVE